MMKAFPTPRPKGPARIRHQVGFKYLEALQSKVLREALLDDQANEELGIGMGALIPFQGEEQRNENRAGKGNGLNLLVLGVCEGENMVETGDVDFVLCRFRQEGVEGVMEVEILEYDTIHTPAKHHLDIPTLIQNPSTPKLPQMDHELGHTFSTAIHLFAQKHSLPLDNLDLIGSGGLLLSLISTPLIGQHRANICLGEGAVISAKTGVTTVSDFRTAEQAVGRRGSGMFAFLTGLVLADQRGGERGRLQVCIEVGGVSSVCFIPGEGKGGVDGMYNWDIGPGTFLLSSALLALGLSPHHQSEASEGEICHEVVEELLEHDQYLHSRPPKTCSKENYGMDFAMRVITMCQFRGCDRASVLATVIRFISASIAQQLLLFGPGRHALNNSDITLDFSPPSDQPPHHSHHHPPYTFLTSQSQSQTAQLADQPKPYTQILTDLSLEFPGAIFHEWQQRTGIPSGNGKKRIGFAMLAVEALLGRAVVVPVNADVRRPNTVTGKLSPGVRWREVCEKSVAFGGVGRGWEGLPEVREVRVVGKVGRGG